MVPQEKPNTLSVLKHEKLEDVFLSAITTNSDIGTHSACLLLNSESRDHPYFSHNLDIDTPFTAQARTISEEFWHNESTSTNMIPKRDTGFPPNNETKDQIESHNTPTAENYVLGIDFHNNYLIREDFLIPPSESQLHRDQTEYLAPSLLENENVNDLFPYQEENSSFLIRNSSLVRDFNAPITPIFTGKENFHSQPAPNSQEEVYSYDQVHLPGTMIQCDHLAREVNVLGKLELKEKSYSDVYETHKNIVKTITHEWEVQDSGTHYGKPQKTESDWIPVSVFKAYTNIKVSEHLIEYVPSTSCFGKINMRLKRAWVRRSNVKNKRHRTY